MEKGNVKEWGKFTSATRYLGSIVSSRVIKASNVCLLTSKRSPYLAL